MTKVLLFVDTVEKDDNNKCKKRNLIVNIAYSGTKMSSGLGNVDIMNKALKYDVINFGDYDINLKLESKNKKRIDD